LPYTVLKKPGESSFVLRNVLLTPALVCVSAAYLLAPAAAGEERSGRVLLEQLQAFAWREAERDGVAALRNAGCPPPLWAEPVFCVETACKARMR
jgi:hypothetical protein